MSQEKLLATTCNLLKMREKSRVHGACDWFCFSLVEKLTLDFKPISKRGNRMC